MKLLSSYYLLLALLFTLTVTGAHQYSLFETAPVTKSWIQGTSAPVDTILHLHVLLHQPRVGAFEQHVLDLSTPDHQDYGKFLSQDQLREYLQPSQQAVNAVKDWLESCSVDKDSYQITHHGDIIDLDITVKDAGELFRTNFYTFYKDGQSIVRAKDYYLPENLRQHIKTVVPIVYFPEVSPHFDSVIKLTDVPQRPPSLEYDPVYCNTTITPACLQGLYQLNNYTAPYNTGTILGISGFLNQSLRVDDLHNFIAQWAPYAPQPFPLYVAILNNDSHYFPDPKQAVAKDTLEAALDVQYAAALALGIPISFFSTSGSFQPPSIPDIDQPTPNLTTNEPYLAQLVYLVTLPDDELPSVLSTSYGENEQSVPRAYANATCNLFGQLAARGVSVIFSSGDDGPGSGCTLNHGNNASFFNPIFPATCPYVTSVGGTRGVEPERAAEFSSGGFSNLFGQHAWQIPAITGFLGDTGKEQGDRWKGLYNPLGRAFPDVSAQASQFIIRDHNEIRGVSGTSASAPVFAAMIANLNALRISQGLPKMGWLNPWLYSNGSSAFTDITEGGSKGCRGRSKYSGLETKAIPFAGWNATRGWDPVTGLGTPVWPRLVEAATIRDWTKPNPESQAIADDGNGKAAVSAANRSGDDTGLVGRGRGSWLSGRWKGSQGKSKSDVGDRPWKSMLLKSSGGGWPWHHRPNMTWSHYTPWFTVY